MMYSLLKGKERFFARVVLYVLIAAACLSLAGCGDPAAKNFYKNAKRDYERGNYAAAANGFENANAWGVYKDATERSRECYYLAGLQDMEEGKPDHAIRYFIKAKDYKDSDGKIKECQAAILLENLASYAKKYECPALDDISVINISWTGTSKEFYTADLHSNQYGSLSDEDKLSYFEILYKVDGASMYGSTFQTDHDKYSVQEGIVDGWHSHSLLRAGQVVFSRPAKDAPTESGDGSGSTREKVPCSMCNGTGRVRYYYGGSATEAAMNGKNDYEYGPCTSCNGTGYQYVDVKPGSSDSGSVICPGCGKRVNSLISKKDAAGVVRNWCSSCWADYNAIMGG